MMRTLAFFIILSLFSPCAFADETFHRAAAEELLLLSNPDKMMDQVWPHIAGMVDQQFKQMDAPEELRPVLKKYTNKMFNVMKAELGFENLKEDFITIYVNTYSESEIRAISDFYKSPVGKKFLEKMPKLIQESMRITQRNMPRMMQQIQAISEEMVAEIESLKSQN